MEEANVVFAIVDGGGTLSPCPEAVRRHKGSGALWIKAGTPFWQASEVIREYASLPRDSIFSYIDRGRWCRIRDEGKIVEPGVIYYFRVVCRGAKRRRKNLTALNSSLHKVGHAFLDEAGIDESAFISFMSKSSTRDICKQMVSLLAAIADNDSDVRFGLCMQFEQRFGIAVCAGEDGFWRRPIGIFLHSKNAFFSFMTVKPGVNGFIRSGSTSLDDCSTELGFLFWVSHLLKIRPKVKVGEELTVMDGESHKRVLRVLEDASHNFITSTVLKVTDNANRRLIMKLGHSPASRALTELLCVESYTMDQCHDEARILRRLQGCSSVPPLVCCGFWEARPVVVTELQGCSLKEAQLIPLHNSSMLERLCKDLTRAVIELSERGVAHADIHPWNIGVYTQPSENRTFYLFDFGLAVELTSTCKAKVRNPIFSSADTLKLGVTTLVTELVSVAYVGLYLAGFQLPWQPVAVFGDFLAYGLRESLANSFEDETKDVSLMCPVVREWFSYVLRLPTNASCAEVKGAAARILHLQP